MEKSVGPFRADILCKDTEEDDLDELLFEKVKELRKVAEDFRVRETDERAPSDLDFSVTVDTVLTEIISAQSEDLIFTNEVPSDEVIATSN